ncbi:hypothetical protein HNQ59_002078 [Chitinivorax tropicus]|uniref:DUF4124 domain-containing protein n=1 Tax=Chitinivorax tropicus TaxID=714531 RepID=A0A840MMU4_9PROT|nr:hypothetical protein [Chitinivorax tropicus]MBB5018785.1 hypothetical protein [Chitinivorax tropicus]
MKKCVWLMLGWIGVTSASQASEIFKCIHPQSGRVTYANSPCPKGESQTKPELIENQIKFTFVEPKSKVEKLPSAEPLPTGNTLQRADAGKIDQEQCDQALREYRSYVQNKPELSNFDLAMSANGVAVRMKCGEAALPVPKPDAKVKVESLPGTGS